MSPRHAKPRSALKNKCRSGIIAGAVTTGAAAMAVLTAGPALSAQSPTTSAAHHAAQIRVPGTGTGTTVNVRTVSDNTHIKVHAVAEQKKKHLPSAADVLKLATSQVGVTENAAGGSKFNRWYMTTPFAKAGVARDGGSISDYANANWCDMFVTWVGAQAGVNGIGGDAFTPTHAKWFEQQGRWGNVPKPGAVVFFSWSGGKTADSIDHIGLVIKDNHDGTIQTVEGNTSDAVKIRTRSTSTVVGYGYPEYAQ
ncbi:MAG: CHAP domain-containing protein [Actinoallomurus sp.]